MHGRVKVRSTEEQQEAKRKERSDKIRAYTACALTLTSKRAGGEADGEAWELTARVLTANPELATWWNYRREMLLGIQHGGSEEALQSAVERELELTAQCLRACPKSYCAWHHRAWSLRLAPRPPWLAELQLTGAFLQMDDRNFHCWDHRRLVASGGGASPTAEVAFTATLLAANFSNFSSWHYRARALALASPHPQRPGRPGRDALPAEFELVQNAIFTDPSDQSAWFYHRWLLGREERAEEVSCLYVSQPLQLVLVTFTRPLNLVRGLEDEEVVLSVERRPARGEWVTPDRRNRYNHVWLFLLSEELHGGETVRVQWGSRPPKQCVLSQGGGESWCRHPVGGVPLGAGLGEEPGEEPGSGAGLDADPALVRQQLDTCRELLQLEPLNKWCLLALVLLVRAACPLRGGESECRRHLATLARVDAGRAAFYRDEASRGAVASAIATMDYADTRVLAVPHRELSCLFETEQLVLVTHLNLCHNRLRCLPRSLCALQSLQVLEVDDNAIETLPGVCYLLNLHHLSLRDNRVSDVANLRPLTLCPRLTTLRLRGNPLTLTDGFPLAVSALLPALTETD